jgi:muconolactone delta-isomerase
MDEVTKVLDITVQGAWTNMPGHTIYFLVDAPNAHVVNQMLAELHIMDWNTVVVNPVVTLEEALEKIKRQKP